MKSENTGKIYGNLELFEYYNHLGFMSPFYIKQRDKLIIKASFSEIEHLKTSQNVLDVVAITELFNRSYTFGDRTLIKGINLTPWMSIPNQNLNDWQMNAHLPVHDNKIVSEEQIAESLFERLATEIGDYIGEKKSVGVLLSGGMDSRVVACVIRYLQNQNIIDVSVVGLTWGTANSRDVFLAEKIADSLGWSWRHFGLDAGVLRDNIEVASQNGCMYSPVHLHAMTQIRSLEGLDCLIAGSFGDSVGRAEYSGVKVKKLEKTSKGMFNKFEMLKKGAFDKGLIGSRDDIEAYHAKFPRKYSHQRYELERQIHYMRKQLNQCMAYVNQKIPVYQAFSSPEVFGYMWSLSSEVRNDKIYFHLLNRFSPELAEFPWARTGKAYLSEEPSTCEEYDKNYHKYGKWIRGDLNALVTDRVLSKSISDINIFNMDVLKNLLNISKKTKSDSMTMIDEYLITVATLADFIERYEVEGLEKVNESVFSLIQRKLICKAQIGAYSAKHRGLV